MSQTTNYISLRHYRPDTAEPMYIEHDAPAPRRRKGALSRLLKKWSRQWKAAGDIQVRSTRHAREIRQQLRDVGLSRFDLLKPETFSVASYIDHGEKVTGAVCGQIEEGGAALLVITDKRIIYLNEIPLFTKLDEVGYGIVDGISTHIGQFDATVTLHTAIGDFTLSRVSITAAERFVDAVEKASIENPQLQRIRPVK